MTAPASDPRETDEVHLRHRRCRLLAGQGPRVGVHRQPDGDPRAQADDPKLDPYLNVDPGTMTPFSTARCSSPTTARRPISTSVTTSASSRADDAGRTTSRPARSTRPSSRRSGAASTSAGPCRSFRTSPTKSRRASSTAPKGQDVRSSRSAARSATSSRCRSSRPSGSCGSSSAPERHLRPRHAGAVHRRRGELKTKPTQHSVKEAARDRHPARYPALPLGAHARETLKKKIALFTNVAADAVFTARTSTASTSSRSVSTRRARRQDRRAAQHLVARARSFAVGADRGPAQEPAGRGRRSAWSASTSTSSKRTSPSTRR